jgi:hypothetical protein
MVGWNPPPKKMVRSEIKHRPEHFQFRCSTSTDTFVFGSNVWKSSALFFTRERDVPFYTLLHMKGEGSNSADNHGTLNWFRCHNALSDFNTENAATRETGINRPPFNCALRQHPESPQSQPPLRNPVYLRSILISTPAPSPSSSST